MTRKQALASRMIVYIGTYTGGGSQGISVGDFDPATGRLTLTGEVRLGNPSFLAVDPRRRRLYAVSEVGEFDGQPGGGVTAFALDPETGGLAPLNHRLSGGAGPCHLSLDAAGRFVLVANYTGGSVALLPLDENGHLTEASDVVSHEGSGSHPTRQAGPHAHFIRMDPEDRYAVAVDLGTDSLWVYRVDTDGGGFVLRPQSRAAVRAGAGPRHLTFHPSGRCAYLINELDSTLTVWDYDAAQGRLSERQTLSTLQAGFTGPNFPAGVQVHPAGLFLYGSNRGHDSIAVFAIDSGTGRVSLRDCVPAGGQNPRGFAIDPTGAYLLVAHQDSDTVVTFTINPATGDLVPTGHRVQVPSPVCVAFYGPSN